MQDMSNNLNYFGSPAWINKKAKQPKSDVVADLLNEFEHRNFEHAPI